MELGSSTLWVVQCETAFEGVEAFAGVFEKTAETVSWYQGNFGKKWHIEAIYSLKPSLTELQAQLEEQAALLNQPTPQIRLFPLGEQDWLAENFRSFSPLTVGKFYVYGSHHEGPILSDKIGLHLDAATAFGSGRHETTQGCLEALQELAEIYVWQNPLDIGCGSGILALAMALLNPAVPVRACDCDPEAVRVTQQNSLLNHQEARLEIIESDGFQEPRLQKHKPYDLIVANILAEPLKRMVEQIAHFSNGWLILSGILTTQAPDLIALYQQNGFSCIQEKILGEWSTLKLKKDGRSDGI